MLYHTCILVPLRWMGPVANRRTEIAKFFCNKFFLHVFRFKFDNEIQMRHDDTLTSCVDMQF